MRLTADVLVKPGVGTRAWNKEIKRKEGSKVEAAVDRVSAHTKTHGRGKDTYDKST